MLIASCYHRGVKVTLEPPSAEFVERNDFGAQLLQILTWFGNASITNTRSFAYITISQFYSNVI